MNQLRWGLWVVFLIPCWIIAFNYHVDLVVVYEVARDSVQNLGGIYRRSVEAGQGRFFYGPFTLVLYQPLVGLSYDALQVVWLTLQSLAYGVFWYFLLRLYPFLSGSGPKVFWPWLAVFLFALNPTHNNFQSGNIQIYILAALLAAEWLTLQGSAWQARVGGMLVTLVAAVKVFPAYVILYYWLVKPREVKQGLVLGAVASVAAPALWFGPTATLDLFQGFWSSLFTYGRENSVIDIPDILCLPSLLARVALWLGLSAGVHKLFSALVVGGVAVGFLGFAFLNRRRLATDSNFNAMLFALALAVMTLVNPSSRVHYIILYVPLFAALLQTVLQGWSSGRGRFEASLLGASFVCVALTVQGVVGKPLNNLLESLSIPTLGLILLVIAGWKRATQSA